MIAPMGRGEADLSLARQLIERRQIAAAIPLLQRMVGSNPKWADAHHLLAEALFAAGLWENALQNSSAAIDLDKRPATFHLLQGRILARLGQSDRAEHAFRAALQRNRLSSAAIHLAEHALAQGAALEALRLVTPLTAGQKASAESLSLHATCLRALGRLEEALVLYRRAAHAAPDDGIGEYNVAALLGDLGQCEDALAATQRALDKGLDAPEVWLVRARAFQGLGRLGLAESAYRECIARRPAFGEAHRELSQLVWMQTSSIEAAAGVLDAVSRVEPANPGVALQRARLWESAGNPEQAYATITPHLIRNPGNLALHLASAHLAGQNGEHDLALDHAERAVTLQPDSAAAQIMLCQTALSAGDPERSCGIAQRLREMVPLDQYVLALQATAWRQLGDDRYFELCNATDDVRVWRIDAPNGWDNLETYLSDLAQALRKLHAFKTHPLEQSVRQGSQASCLLGSGEPAIQAFFKSIERSVQEHMSTLRHGRDTPWSRLKRNYKVQGAWSVELKPGGRHINHVHPQGWLSSACYIEVPEAVQKDAKEGWLKIGEPGVHTEPALSPERFIKPVPGALVLFPSYMWHGTLPFGGAAPRLSVAFDIAPSPEA